MNIPKMTLSNLLNQLTAESLIDAAAIPNMHKLAQQEEADKRPWYLQLLIAISAYIASICILLALGSLIIVPLVLFVLGEETEVGIGIVSTIMGGILCGIAVVSQKNFAKNRLFVSQMMLTTMLIGAVLTAFGISAATSPLWDDLFDDRWVTTPSLVTLAVTAVTFILYNSRVYRFIAFVCGLIAFSTIVYEWQFEDGIHIMIALCAAFSVYLWQKRPEWQASNRADMLDPLSYALPIALCAFTTFSLMNTNNSGIDYWWLSAIILGCILIFLAINLFREYDVSPTSPAAITAMIGIVLLTLPSFIMPGILAGFLILVLAFWRNNPVLMGLATLYFLFGIGYYYYDLNLTLLVKSVVLMATGGVLLIGSAVTRRLTA